MVSRDRDGDSEPDGEGGFSGQQTYLRRNRTENRNGLRGRSQNVIYFIKADKR